MKLRRLQYWGWGKAPFFPTSGWLALTALTRWVTLSSLLREVIVFQLPACLYPPPPSTPSPPLTFVLLCALAVSLLPNLLPLSGDTVLLAWGTCLRSSTVSFTLPEDLWSGCHWKMKKPYLCRWLWNIYQEFYHILRLCADRGETLP